MATLYAMDGSTKPFTLDPRAPYRALVASVQQVVGHHLAFIGLGGGQVAMCDDDCQGQQLAPNSAAREALGVSLQGPVLLCSAEEIRQWDAAPV